MKWLGIALSGDGSPPAPPRPPRAVSWIMWHLPAHFSEESKKGHAHLGGRGRVPVQTPRKDSGEARAGGVAPEAPGTPPRWGVGKDRSYHSGGSGRAPPGAHHSPTWPPPAPCPGPGLSPLVVAGGTSAPPFPSPQGPPVHVYIAKRGFTTSTRPPSPARDPARAAGQTGRPAPWGPAHPHPLPAHRARPRPRSAPRPPRQAPPCPLRPRPSLEAPPTHGPLSARPRPRVRVAPGPARGRSAHRIGGEPEQLRKRGLFFKICLF